MVVPGVTPVTTPVGDTVALPEVLLHTPPGAASTRLIVAATQTTFGPVMVPALGRGFTVTTRVAAAVPQLLVTA